MSIENRLKELIKEKGGDLTNFCRALGFAESTVRNALAKPNGYKGMRAENLLGVCEALKIDLRSLVLDGEIKELGVTGFKLTQKELALIENYRSLDSFGIEAVDQTLSTEYRRNQYYDNKINYIYIPKASLPVAAGLGEDLDGVEFESLKIPRTREAEISDFVVRISGDSMEPDFPDGSYVLVRVHQPVQVGEVGIFIYQGEAFIKELGEGVLVSINKKYKPITIADTERFYIAGKVLGITEAQE